MKHVPQEALNQETITWMAREDLEVVNLFLLLVSIVKEVEIIHRETIMIDHPEKVVIRGKRDRMVVDMAEKGKEEITEGEEETMAETRTLSKEEKKEEGKDSIERAEKVVMKDPTESQGPQGNLFHSLKTPLLLPTLAILITTHPNKILQSSLLLNPRFQMFVWLQTKEVEPKVTVTLSLRI